MPPSVPSVDLYGASFDSIDAGRTRQDVCAPDEHLAGAGQSDGCLAAFEHDLLLCLETDRFIVYRRGEGSSLAGRGVRWSEQPDDAGTARVAVRVGDQCFLTAFHGGRQLFIREVGYHSRELRDRVAAVQQHPARCVTFHDTPDLHSEAPYRDLATAARL